ncbi:MAG: hypothetical protein JWM34_2093 [Ilumatobacteraceae bacterium]|nr:hypothetical protein [Ilumatobacteraceae bacterium]
MDLSADMTAPCAPHELFGWVDDLAIYPSWMGLVHRAEPIEARDGRPRWDVELRAKVGPFARSKRLGMARTVCTPDADVVFERDETDGRQHSMWRLTVRIAPGNAEGSSSAMVMQLHYGGSLWTGGLVERVLHDEIVRSRDRLVSKIGETRP